MLWIERPARYCRINWLAWSTVRGESLSTNAIAFPRYLLMLQVRWHSLVSFWSLQASKHLAAGKAFYSPPMRGSTSASILSNTTHQSGRKSVDKAWANVWASSAGRVISNLSESSESFGRVGYKSKFEMSDSWKKLVTFLCFRNLSLSERQL